MVDLSRSAERSGLDCVDSKSVGEIEYGSSERLHQKSKGKTKLID